MKKITIILFLILIMTGCGKDKENIDETIVLEGKYECFYDTSGIEYSMIYNFFPDKIEVTVNSQKTYISYEVKNNKISTINIVNGKDIIGNVTKDKLSFTENDTKIKFTCNKKD